MRFRKLLLPATLGLSLSAATSGGWAVFTVEDLPQHLTVGQETELRFKIREHGVEVRHDLRPTVTASLGKTELQTTAAHQGNGVYAARLTVPSAGSWTVALDANWHAAKTRLLPIAAVAAGTRTAIMPEHYRGKTLFVAKGCVTCHVHGDVANSGPVPIGPPLTGQRFKADYLKEFLANPSIKPPTRNERMPNLELKPQEIAALVAFINGGTGIASR